jgi:hypothetical protein
MATTAQDNLVKAQGFALRQSNYNLDATGSNDFNQGDMLWFDTTNNILKALDTDGHASAFAGVALRTSPLQLYINQNSLTAAKHYDQQGLVGIAGLYFFKTTAGETYKDGTSVYIGADAQTITTVAGTNLVGVTKMRPSATSVTGASGVTVDVFITVQYPVKSL